MTQLEMSEAKRNLKPIQKAKAAQRNILIRDCRIESEKSTETVVDINGLDLSGFLLLVSKEFSIPSNETFVLTTTDRTLIDSDRYDELQDGNILHLWHTQPAAQERIDFQPHYNTIVEGGLYEYYASAGQNSLPYAFAELIDNSLSATTCVTGVRTIDIRLLFDESQGKPAVVILDNGRGMTSKQLNNWAVYRLSKFTRDNGTFSSDESAYVRPDPVPHSLNSDISFFGVGGKQAVFYIGQSTRMITKPVGSPDVHELVISKEDFEKKARNKEEIYSGFIRNRKVGDSTHIQDEEERFLHGLIAEEVGKESFTAVVVTGVQLEHITLLKQDFQLWTRELAHLYHYYVHGFDGNIKSSNRNKDHVSNIDIQISLLERSPKVPRVVNLREITNDMQTLYINSAADTFEFKAYADHDGMVEGILRYHPFLYDRETYPEDPYATVPVDEDDDEDCVVINQARGKRPIFECFWNGRLIPYTTVSEFAWCSRPKNKKVTPVPEECYSRVSGVLFTNDRFPVSQNKLTFMDLQLRLQENTTFFTRIVQGQEQRGKIEKEFNQWLKNCHEKWDKQVKFMGFKGTITRTDVATKKMQSPWATFSSIEWDGRTYKAGQYVKSQKTLPIFYGSVVQFMLYGDHEGDIYATGGQVQVAMEPKELYDEMKIIPISKIDKTGTKATIKRSIDEELAKLPVKLKVTWPEENPWSQNDVRAAGTPLGPLQVEILNKKGESISRMPSTYHGAIKKLLLELKVVWHGPNGDVETNSHIAQHAVKWAFWFKKMENLNKLGKYTLHLNTVLNESNATVFAGKQLPSHELHFSISEGRAEWFVVRAMSTPLHVGEPFDIPLELVDEYGHPAQPPPDLKPLLECSGLEVTYEGTDASGTTFTIKGVRVKGTVSVGKMHDMKVVLSGLMQVSQTVQISLLPGNPHSLMVTPDDQPITVENGTSATFDIKVLDEAGNVTVHPKLIVRCQLQGVPGPLVTAIDCSNTGAGVLVTKTIHLKAIKGEGTVKARFDVPSQKSMAVVQRELVVLPSRRVSRLEVFSQEEEGDATGLKDKERVAWAAGDVLGNLYYRLYDEGGREVPLSEELAPRIKVNWTADVNLEELAQGKLPNIQVPTLVQEEHFYQVSYQDHNLSVNSTFTIVPHPDEPKHLKATLDGASVRMGEVLSGKIYLQLTDQYGNKVQTLTSTCVDSLTADGEGLDTSSLAFIWEESSHSMAVQGVRFLPGLPGTREISFTWKDFVCDVRIRVTAGLPAQFKLVDGPEEPLQVLNEQGIATPFTVQLCDEWGNPSTDQRVVVRLTTSSCLKMGLDVHSQPVNAEGKASFVVGSISGPKGEYKLEFRGSFNTKPIPGPSVKVSIIPDPCRPVRLAVEYNTSALFPAGGTLTVFTVSVMSEEGCPIRNLNPAAMSMLMWNGEASSNKLPPTEASQLKCSKPLENEKDDCFYFRDKVIPERVGTYTIQFSLYVATTTKMLWSQQYTINVVANEPVKLSPDTPPPTPVVSNNDVMASRTLVEDMTLRIMDAYNNPAGLELQGKVVVTIRSSRKSSDKNLPLFRDKVNSLQFSLSEGQVHVTNLAIMENSPGEDGHEYILVFSPVIPGFCPQKPLTAFQLPFRFYNDVENQKQMSELTRKKDQLSQTIEMYKSLFDTNKQLITELNHARRDASNKETHLNTELRRKSLNTAQLSSIQAIEAVIHEKTAEAELIEQQPRRRCHMPDPFRGSQDVLGKVAHLALLQDDDAAAVVSWHLLGDMDCVVTMTTAAARKIYDDTQGRQQVMPLDTVFCRKSERPLPHVKNGRNSFTPIGNPVFVRDLLIYPLQDFKESCQMVFGNLLGDTILIDDLDSANHYRKGVVQSQVPCPTILTRKGERIRANGKFGGLQNKAPAIEQLRGQVFGAPLPQQYHILLEQIDLLQQKRLAMQKTMQVKRDFESHMQYLKSPEMLQKEEELQKQERHLRDIERKLESTPVRTGTRSLEMSGESSTPVRGAKRGAEVAGQIRVKRARGRSRKNMDML